MQGRALSSFSAQGVPGRTCSHEQEISHTTNKLKEKKTRKPCENPGPEDKNTPEAWPPGPGGGTRPGHTGPSARWTPCPALPVTFRSQSSWSSYSALMESQCQPILQMGKLMGQVGVEFLVEQRVHSQSLATPPTAGQFPEVRTVSGFTDSAVHGLRPKGGLEARLCLVQGLLTTFFQP